MGNLNFAIIDSKDRFESMLNNNEIEETLVVFIKDTQQIWTHGLYFGNTSGGDFDGLINRIGNIENIINEIGTSEAVKQSHIVLTQEEYDSRLEAGTIFDDVFYYIIEE
jgi:hypothetical protein